MSTSELDEIMASVRAAISRAYALGRLDALKHVITTMEAEESSVANAKPLALMAPQAAMSAPEPAFAPSPEPAFAQAPEPAPELAVVHSPEPPAHGGAASSRVSVVQAHPDLPANDDRAAASAEASAQLPWYRRPAK